MLPNPKKNGSRGTDSDLDIIRCDYVLDSKLISYLYVLEFSPCAQLLFITKSPPFVRGLGVCYGSIVTFYPDLPCLQRARQTSTGFYLAGIRKKSSDGLKKVDITLLCPTKSSVPPGS